MGAVVLEGAELASVIRSLELTDIVEFLPRVPRRQSLQAMVDASALLLLQPGHGVAVPAKLYEYFAAGRPILAIAEGETATIVQRSGVGVTAQSNNEDAIVAALEEVMRLSVQPGGLAEPALYDGAKRADEIVELIGGLLASAPAGAALSLQKEDV